MFDSRTLGSSHQRTSRLIIVALLVVTFAAAAALSAPVTRAAPYHAAQPAISHASQETFSHTLCPTSSSPSPYCICYDVYCSRAVTTNLGYDACQQPNTQGMQAWWNYPSPYYWANLYIGGLNWSCRPLPSYLNYNWISTIQTQGWDLLPTWVSYQAPCADPRYGAQMSWTTGTAYNQGYNDAASAAQTAHNLSIASAVIYDDMEYFSGSSSCYAAVAAFVNGWSTELHNYGFLAGVYESPYDLVDLCGRSSSITEPDDVWIADWNGSTDTNNTPPLSNGCWQYSQRIHQYSGGVNQTYCLSYNPNQNCTTLNIDQDSANGDVAVP